MQKVHFGDLWLYLYVLFTSKGYIEGLIKFQIRPNNENQTARDYTGLDLILNLRFYTIIYFV